MMDSFNRIETFTASKKMKQPTSGKLQMSNLKEEF